MSSSAKGLAGRYAGALYALADESGKIDAIVKDMTGIAELVSGNPDMRTLVESPAISWADQTKAVTAVLEKAGAGHVDCQICRHGCIQWASSRPLKNHFRISC